MNANRFCISQQMLQNTPGISEGTILEVDLTLEASRILRKVGFFKVFFENIPKKLYVKFSMLLQIVPFDHLFQRLNIHQRN